MAKRKRRRRRTTPIPKHLQVESPPFRDARITHPKQRAFLAAYAKCGNITRAAAIAGVNRSTHHVDWLKNPIYVEAFAQAREHGGDELEEVARLRAIHGSDTLIIFLLKGLRPETYRERHEVTGAGGGPLGVAVNVSYDHNMNPPPTAIEQATAAAAAKKSKA